MDSGFRLSPELRSGWRQAKLCFAESRNDGDRVRDSLAGSGRLPRHEISTLALKPGSLGARAGGQRRRFPMLKMYGFWRSAASFRVRIALNLKGIAFEEEMIDLDAGVQHGASYLKVNPQAVVPSLIIDDGPPLTQSIAILEWLEETHPTPPLLPRDARGRARVRGLALIVACDAHPLIVPRIRNYLEREMHLDEAARNRWLQHWTLLALETLEARLSKDR